MPASPPSFSDLLFNEHRVESAISSIIAIGGGVELKFGIAWGPVVHIVLEGEVELRMAGDAGTSRLREGDCALLFYGDRHRLGGGATILTPDILERSAKAGDEVPRQLALGGAPAVAKLFTAVLDLSYLGNPTFATRGLPPLLTVRRDPSEDDPRARTLRFDTDQILAECAGQGAAGFAALFASLHFTHILRTAYRRNWGDRRIDLRAPNLRRIASVIEMVRAHPERDWTIMRLSRYGGLSRSAFFEAFPEYVGMPPMHFVTKVRMDRAARLLLGGSLSFCEVAKRCGYRLESSFARAFRNYHGISPRQFSATTKGGEQNGFGLPTARPRGS